MATKSLEKLNKTELYERAQRPMSRVAPRWTKKS